MKSNLFLSTVILGTCLFASCSKDEPVMDANVPTSVQQNFQQKYPGVTDVHWDKVQNYHVARFNGRITRAAASTYTSSAWFTQDGQYCQSDEDIDFAALPDTVQKSFNAYKTKLYPEWTIDDCEILAREGMSCIFVIEIESADDQEREISVSAMGDILKDVLDEDEDDDILPVNIPQQLTDTLNKIFPDSTGTYELMELEIDDDEIEVDLMHAGKHKEVELDNQYNLVKIEYEVSLEEASLLMAPEVMEKLVAMANKAGIDLTNPEAFDELEIEVTQMANGEVTFEVEIEIGELELELEIDAKGEITLKK